MTITIVEARNGWIITVVSNNATKQWVETTAAKVQERIALIIEEEGDV